MDSNVFANVALATPKPGLLFGLSCIVCCESDLKFRGLRHQKSITPAVLLQQGLWVTFLVKWLHTQKQRKWRPASTPH